MANQSTPNRDGSPSTIQDAPGTARLTIAIPYYSGKELLRCAVESVLRQGNPAWQLIVCDDSPRDENVGEMIAAYGDARMRYHRNPRTLGLAENWNTCLFMAKTELVTIVHADDQLLTNYADIMLAAAARHPAAVGFFCNAQIIDIHGRPMFSLPDQVKRFLKPAVPGELVLCGPNSAAGLLRGNFICCPTMCYRKSRLRPRPFDARRSFVLDLAFFIELMFAGDTLIGLPETAYAYRRHEQSATAKQTANLRRFHEEIELYRELAQLGNARGWNRLEKVARQRRMIWLNLAYCTLQDLRRLRFRDARDKIRLLTCR